jgi:hypothetical protein
MGFCDLPAPRRIELSPEIIALPDIRLGRGTGFAQGGTVFRQTVDRADGSRVYRRAKFRTKLRLEQAKSFLWRSSKRAALFTALNNGMSSNGLLLKFQAQSFTKPSR